MKACHMLAGLKNVCRTWALPGASRKTATSAASTATVLTVEIAAARRPPPLSRRGPRPVVSNDPGIGPPPPPRIMTGRRPCRRSGLDGRDAEVGLQVLLLQLLQRPVALQRGDGLVDAGDQGVSLGQQQAVVLAGARELAHHLG